MKRIKADMSHFIPRVCVCVFISDNNRVNLYTISDENYICYDSIKFPFILRNINNRNILRISYYIKELCTCQQRFMRIRDDKFAHIYEFLLWFRNLKQTNARDKKNGISHFEKTFDLESENLKSRENHRIDLSSIIEDKRVNKVDGLRNTEIFEIPNNSRIEDSSITMRYGTVASEMHCKAHRVVDTR